MSKQPRRSVWNALFAALLIPIAYAMYTGRFGMALICVVALVAVRFLGLRTLRDDSEDGHEEES